MNKSVSIALGTVTSSGDPFVADVVTILRSNLLVQAGSGGGKSWLLRRMIEQTFSIVPQIIIDPEGEFSTLREKFDVILVGKDGDTPADVRSADLLAHKILELGVSAVVDLYEMSPLVRPVWTARFVQALVDAPKSLWRDLLVYVDEAHTMAPEPGHGAVDSEAHRRCRSALIEFASRGRKRGYGLVAATQRLGKLSKDFAAELKNVIVGQTFIDIDRERAAGSLGIAKSDKAAFFKTVKTLAPGQFYAMGRALLLEPELVKIGPVATHHPEAGRRQVAPPPPTAKIKHLLPQLADLPREAEVKVATEKELRARIVALEIELTKATTMAKAKPAVPVPFVPEQWRKAVDDAYMLIDAIGRDAGASFKVWMTRLAEAVTKLETTQKALPPADQEPLDRLLASSKMGRQDREQASEPRKPVGRPPEQRSIKLEGVVLGRCAKAILAVLSSRSGDVTNASQLAILSGYSKSSSGFANALFSLRTMGLIEGSRDHLAITLEGNKAAGFQAPLPMGKALLDYWLGKLGRCEREILKAIHETGSLSRDEISNLTGYSSSSSGFSNALSKLRVLGLIAGRSGENLTISEVFSER